MKDLANSLFISPSEVSESLNRSKIAALIDYKKSRINRQNFYEFLEHGFKFVFPETPNGMAIGFPTAHSHPFLKKYIRSDIEYIWPDQEGKVEGLIIEPLYKNQVKAIRNDELLYKLLALLDVLRVGKNRETIIALDELKKNILG